MKRKRTTSKISSLEQELARLEKENLELQLQLKLGIHASESLLREKESIVESLKSFVAEPDSSSNDNNITEAIKKYVDKFTDYGRDRSDYQIGNEN